MKKTAGLALVMLAVLMMVSAAWAESSAFSKQELDQIETIAEAAFPRGTEVIIETWDPSFEPYTVVKCSVPRERGYIIFHVNLSEAVTRNLSPDNVVFREAAKKIENGIEAVLKQRNKRGN